MTANNPEALRYILQEDLYLLEQDKIAYLNREPQQEEQQVTTPEAAPVVTTPVAAVPQPVSAPPQPVIETPKVVYKYLGQNKKHLLILVNYQHEEYIAEAHLKALESTLVRKGSALDDAVVLNMAKYPVSTYNDLLTEFKPERILVLGANATPGGLTGTVLNQSVNLGGKMVLYTYSFDEMMGNKDKTRTFWEQMKNL